jgi:hypothetical protein
MGSSGLLPHCENDKNSGAFKLEGSAATTSRRFKMTTTLGKAAIGALAALTMAACVTATATPSVAQGWHGGYWYGGGWGAPVAAGILGGFALGALAGSAYANGPAYYNGCFWQNRPVYDAWGNFAGYQPVWVCY